MTSQIAILTGVERTASGHCNRALTVREALVLLLLMLSAALGLAALTNTLTVQLSVVGAALAMLDPWRNASPIGRKSCWASLFLEDLAFVASINTLPNELWWFFAANVLWTVGR